MPLTECQRQKSKVRQVRSLRGTKCKTSDILISSQGEECRPHGALWPAQVVLRLDQQIHQRKAICLTFKKTLLKNSLLEHFKEIHFWKIHHKSAPLIFSTDIPAESHLFLRFIYKQKLVINSNWHHEPLYNKNNERWMLGCWVHTQ